MQPGNVHILHKLHSISSTQQTSYLTYMLYCGYMWLLQPLRLGSMKMMGEHLLPNRQTHVAGTFLLQFDLFHVYL